MSSQVETSGGSDATFYLTQIREAANNFIAEASEKDAGALTRMLSDLEDLIEQQGPERQWLATFVFVHRDSFLPDTECEIYSFQNEVSARSKREAFDVAEDEEFEPTFDIEEERVVSKSRTLLEDPDIDPEDWTFANWWVTEL